MLQVTFTDAVLLAATLTLPLCPLHVGDAEQIAYQMYALADAFGL